MKPMINRSVYYKNELKKEVEPINVGEVYHLKLHP